MIQPVCTRCAARFPTGKRTSQESVNTAATDAGWFLGLPWGRAYCPRCHRMGNVLPTPQPNPTQEDS